jgi:uncharacterized membrane protein YfcA
MHKRHACSQVETFSRNGPCRLHPPSYCARMMLVWLLLVGAVAGWLGALVGIGGGVILVPTLVMLFHVPIHVAIATSLASVIATSTAAGSAYVSTGLTNMRLGMTLEVATSLGGLTGGIVAARASKSFLSGLFGVMLLITAFLLWRKPEHQAEGASTSRSHPRQEGWETAKSLAGGYYDEYLQRTVSYRARRLALGSGIAAMAGVVSGLLGVGGGFIKVPAMTLGMSVPMRVAAATSNFMIGVTALSSFVVYWARGYVEPGLCAPLVAGVALGSVAGTVSSGHFSPGVLRLVLAVVLALVSVQMVLRAFGLGI